MGGRHNYFPPFYGIVSIRASAIIELVSLELLEKVILIITVQVQLEFYEVDSSLIILVLSQKI